VSMEGSLPCQWKTRTDCQSQETRQPELQPSDERSEQGQDLVEYGLLCSLVVLAIIAAFPPFASIVTSTFSTVSSVMS